MPSEADLKRALRAMIRVTALDAPPDEKGGRVIWHRGGGDSDLVSWVQADGKLIKQQLVLFDDVILWQHGRLVRTGRVERPGEVLAAPQLVDTKLDAALDKARLQRLRTAVDGYQGGDHYIEHLIRVLGLVVSHALGSAPVVTRAAGQLSGRGHQKRKAPALPLRQLNLAIGLGLVAVLVLIAVLYMRRAA